MKTSQVVTTINILLSICLSISATQTTYFGPTGIANSQLSKPFNTLATPMMYFLKNNKMSRVNLTNNPPPAPVTLSTEIIDQFHVIRGQTAPLVISFKYSGSDIRISGYVVTGSGASSTLSHINTAIITGQHFIKLSFTAQGDLLYIPFNRHGDPFRRRLLQLIGDDSDKCALGTINMATGAVSNPVIKTSCTRAVSGFEINGHWVIISSPKFETGAG